VRTTDKSRFQGQIGKSNEERHHVRKIKLDDLRVAIERQMKDKYVGKLVDEVHTLKHGEQVVRDDQSADIIVTSSQL
jgi:hypothetical protein